AQNGSEAAGNRFHSTVIRGFMLVVGLSSLARFLAMFVKRSIFHDFMAPIAASPQTTHFTMINIHVSLSVLSLKSVGKKRIAKFSAKFGKPGRFLRYWTPTRHSLRSSLIHR